MKTPITGKLLIRNKYIWISGLSIEISLLNQSFEYTLCPSFKKSLDIRVDSPFELSIKCFKTDSVPSPAGDWLKTLGQMQKVVSRQLKAMTRIDEEAKVGEAR